MHNNRDLTVGEARGLIELTLESIHLYLNNERYRKIVEYVAELENDLAKVRGRDFKQTILSNGLNPRTLSDIDAKFKSWLPIINSWDDDSILRVYEGIGESSEAWDAAILFWSDLFQLWNAVVIEWEHHLAGFLKTANVDVSNDFLRGSFEISLESDLYHLVRMKVDLLDKVWLGGK